MKKCILVFAALIVSGAAVFSALLYCGVIQLNDPSEKNYPVRGVDVSAYQGQIDWPVLSRQNIRFAYIKATEGSGYVDSKFSYNWENASKTSLRIGAYHFFSYDSAGDTQAANFIKTVTKIDGMLPPVVDIEFYGDKKKNPPDKTETRKNLTILLDKIEEYCGMKPVIYATNTSYKLYISGSFEDYDIWICDIIKTPFLPDLRKWVFWQYSHLAVLDGYSGQEKHIDMNVFSGTKEEFAEYGKGNEGNE